MFKLFFNNHPLFAEVIKAFTAKLEQVKKVYEQEIEKIDQECILEMQKANEVAQTKKEVLATDLVEKNFTGLV